MKNTIPTLWKRIETWMDKHAPDLWLALADGASEEEVQRAETLMRLTLPEEVKASYRLHNGGYCPRLSSSEWDFGGVKSQISAWQEMKSELEHNLWGQRTPYYFTEEAGDFSLKAGPIQPVWWDLHWIPLGGDGSGNYLCLDLAPAPGGTAGQIILWDHEVGPAGVLFKSFQELLAAFASDLEGRPSLEIAGFPFLLPADPFDTSDDLSHLVTTQVLPAQAATSLRVIIAASEIEATLTQLLAQVRLSLKQLGLQPADDPSLLTKQLAEERLALKQLGFQPMGDPTFAFVRYYGYQASRVDLEVGVLIEANALTQKGNLTASTLAGGEIATFRHATSTLYPNPALGCRAIAAWSKEQHRELVGIPWIVYFFEPPYDYPAGSIKLSSLLAQLQDPPEESIPEESPQLPKLSSLAEVRWLLKEAETTPPLP